MKLKEKYMLKRTDLHAHTLHSDGAFGVEESIGKRLHIAEIIGISDHYVYLLRKSNLWEIYIQQIKSYRSFFDGHEVLVGVEIFYRDLVNDIDKIRFMDLDYLIIEHYEYVPDKQNFVRVLEAVKSRFDGDIILAHPDFDKWLLVLGEDKFVETLEFLRDIDVAIEINVNQGYFHIFGQDFRKRMNDTNNIYVKLLKQTGSLISVGTDAHGYEEELFNRFEMTYNYLLEQNNREVK